VNARELFCPVPRHAFSARTMVGVAAAAPATRCRREARRTLWAAPMSLSHVEPRERGERCKVCCR